MDLDILYESNPPALVRAVRDGNVELVKDLLKTDSVHPNSADHRGWTPLHEAGAFNQFEIARILLADERSNPDSTIHSGENALEIAVEHNASLELVSLLFKYTSKVDVNQLLRKAANSASPKTVEYIINLGADVNSRDWLTEQPPLLVAIDRGHYEIIRILLDSGADVNELHEHYYTPLMFAIGRNCHLSIISLLISKGSNVNIQTPDGRMPLICAIEMERPDIALELLNHNADANIVHEYGVALTLAVQAEETELVERLIHVTSPKVLESLCEKETFYGLFCYAIDVKNEHILSILLNHKFSEAIVEAPVRIRHCLWRIGLKYDYIGPLAFLLKEKMHQFGDRTLPVIELLISKGISVEPRKPSYLPPLVGLLLSSTAIENVRSPLLKPALKTLLSSGVNVDHMTSVLPDALLVAVSSENVEALYMLLPYTRYTPCDIVRIGVAHNMIFISAFILKHLIKEDDYSSLKTLDDSAELAQRVRNLCSNNTFTVPSLAVFARQKVRQSFPCTKTTAEFLGVVNNLAVPEVLRSYLRYSH